MTRKYINIWIQKLSSVNILWPSDAIWQHEFSVNIGISNGLSPGGIKPLSYQSWLLVRILRSIHSRAISQRAPKLLFYNKFENYTCIFNFCFLSEGIISYQIYGWCKGPCNIYLIYTDYISQYTHVILLLLLNMFDLSVVYRGFMISIDGFCICVLNMIYGLCKSVIICSIAMLACFIWVYFSQLTKLYIATYHRGLFPSFVFPPWSLNFPVRWRISVSAESTTRGNVCVTQGNNERPVIHASLLHVNHSGAEYKWFPRGKPK